MAAAPVNPFALKYATVPQLHVIGTELQQIVAPAVLGLRAAGTFLYASAQHFFFSAAVGGLTFAVPVGSHKLVDYCRHSNKGCRPRPNTQSDPLPDEPPQWGACK